MAVVDPRLVAALRTQLAERRRILARGGYHVGWKLGMGEREGISGHIAVGYLASATLVEPGGSYRAGGPGAQLHADAEAYVELAGPDQIGAFGVALEIVDLAPLAGEPESIVATNIFHRAVSFGPLAPGEPEGSRVSVRVNGTERNAGTWPIDLTERIARAAVILDAVGEGLRHGDRIITGSIVQVPIASGDSVAAVIGGDPAVTLEIA